MATKYFKTPYASTGDRTVIPEAAQPSGDVSYAEGWTQDYQLDPDTEPTAKDIDRKQTNEVLYQITLSEQQYQQVGTPNFITTADNGGTAFSYQQGARVRYDAGSGDRTYESLVGSNDTLPTDATKWAEVPSPLAGSIPAGAMMAFGGTTAPAGWLLCAGQAINRTTFANLFSAIGTNYGVGNTTTTFNVPDLRGRVPAGQDDMNGSAANRLTNGVAGFVGTQIGASGGDERFQQHNHAVTDPGHTHSGVPGASSGAQASGGGSNPAGNQAIGTSTTGISIQNTGTGNSQNVQPTLIVSWIIKT